MSPNVRDRLVTYLTDAYAIEQQSLAQLRTAPRIVGEPTLAMHFRDHLAETERHAALVRERLEAHGAAPSRVKDAVMAVGGKGMMLFARVQPDTPGKLTAHSYSYEALEWAAYDLLARVAERAGDPATAAVAREIRDEERAMLDRLALGFAAAVEASLAERERSEPEAALGIYLADAHALEAQSTALLEKAAGIGGDPELDRLYAEHLDESREQARRVEERLAAFGRGASFVKDVALRAAALNWGAFFQAQQDTPGKLAAFAYAFEHLEIAGYELLRRVAARVPDEPTMRLCAATLVEERAMAERLAAAFDRAAEASLVAADAVGVRRPRS